MRVINRSFAVAATSLLALGVAFWSNGAHAAIDFIEHNLVTDGTTHSLQQRTTIR
jgi:hypothetical protein